MRAAVVHAFDQPLRIEERPVPTPGHGQVLGEDRDLRPLPHRYPRRPRRLARQAPPAVRPRT